MFILQKDKGTPLFIISLDEDFGSEIEVIQPTTKSDLETRVEYLENKLNNLEKSISEDDKKSGGPAEIRTQDPRRVKARQMAILTDNQCHKTTSESLNDVWTKYSEPFYVWLQAKDISKATKRDYYNSLSRFLMIQIFKDLKISEASS
ncbi:hypothetical protein [Methanohalophilus halophilus]|uniref:Uncharacterized protein n=1 Tax=Methanohalophilus halophilus TaxID=2177 RepID=A0A1L3Q4G0_9EURY|nr:hypothetical protein [Methanohalophilus halophilus]APH39777.1 hypothetical protein BHR79_10015 [Methanohalophilus halophilus]RNI08882.1 hypothetical protein EFE40_05245 [Methanohalophilus halophilus]